MIDSLDLIIIRPLPSSQFLIGLRPYGTAYARSFFARPGLASLSVANKRNRFLETSLRLWDQVRESSPIR
jgi:hypothetical protein